MESNIRVNQISFHFARFKRRTDMLKSQNCESSDGLAAKYRVDWEQTTWNRDMEAFAFKCTDELAPLDHFIG